MRKRFRWLGKSIRDSKASSNSCFELVSYCRTPAFATKLYSN
ncbi:Uncharacterised protein [Vibrio cholerae]|nr:Uncharacterised protein [Vibrio cholerae]